MQIGQDFQLTYCTNIHPGDDWAQVQSSLAEYGPRLKQRISPDAPFGMGLRLSHVASVELLAGDRLQALREQLDRDGLYVFTMNGFPYGSFHRTAVKDLVHAPDWQTPERADYTIRLARILAALLPGDIQEGSISTSPLSYKPWVSQTDDWQTVSRASVAQLVRVTQALMQIESETGKLVHVDLEPEPDGLLETADEVCVFFEDHLLTYGAELLCESAQISIVDAQQTLLRHVGVCLDTCHLAIEYESPREFVEKMQRVGIRIGKVQISSALQVPIAKAGSADGVALHDIPRELAPYVESTYLHQVIQRNRDGVLVRYHDLPEALELLAVAGDAPEEWRVHFHVPVFAASCGAFATTQQTILDTFALLAENPFTRHLEIETYTWEVLPAELKKDITESIVREFAWTLSAFPQGLSQGGTS